jgi:hypothetical protein
VVSICDPHVIVYTKAVLLSAIHVLTCSEDTQLV